MENDIDGLRTEAYEIYNDMVALEDLGFTPIGYPPFNPAEAPDTESGLRNVIEFNSHISLVYLYGPDDAVLTARPCEDIIEIKAAGQKYEMPRAFLHLGPDLESSVRAWLEENRK